MQSTHNADAPEASAYAIETVRIAQLDAHLLRACALNNIEDIQSVFDKLRLIRIPSIFIHGNRDAVDLQRKSPIGLPRD